MDAARALHGPGKFLDDVPGSGRVAALLEARGAGSWALSVRCRGEGILPPFPAEQTFFALLRVGTTTSVVSTSGELRDIVPGMVRRFP